MLNYFDFKTQCFLVNNISLLCRITTHSAQARANYFLSEMLRKVVTLKKSLNQQLAANQRSLFFLETHIRGQS